MAYLWGSENGLNLTLHPSEGREANASAQRGGEQMPLNQFGQWPIKTSDVINGDVRSGESADLYTDTVKTGHGHE